MTPQLEPCPFCDESQRLTCELVDGLYQVECEGCGAVGPKGVMPTAISGWNGPLRGCEECNG